jgi:hypothetical protein
MFDLAAIATGCFAFDLLLQHVPRSQMQFALDAPMTGECAMASDQRPGRTRASSPPIRLATGNSWANSGARQTSVRFLSPSSLVGMSP